MELSELSSILREKRESLQKKYNLPNRTRPRSGILLDFSSNETGGLVGQLVHPTGEPFTMQELDNLIGEPSL